MHLHYRSTLRPDFMSWQLENDTVKDSQGQVICTLAPNLNPFYANLIKKTPDAYALVMDFLGIYKSGRKMTKGEVDRFDALIELDKNYNFKWRADGFGNIVDVNDSKVCSFTSQNTPDAFFIERTPEIFQAIQEIVKSFRGISPKQRPFYQKLQKLIDQIDSR